MVKSKKVQKAGSDSWYSKIRDELTSRDAACQSRYGPHNEYVRPSVDPYKYPDVETFKRAYPFSVNGKRCKIIHKPRATTDINKRYFEDARHASQCKSIGGIWSDNAINRNNKYDKGVCWTNEEDAYCSDQYQVPVLLRPQDVKSMDVTKLVNKAENMCSGDPRCRFVKTGKYSYDCFSKKAVEVTKGRVSKPPSNMPKDVTKGNIEKFLYEWYGRSLATPPPETNPLIGKGNRCSPQAAAEYAQEAHVRKDPYMKKFERARQEIRSLNPSYREDFTDLMKYLSLPDLKRYKKEYQEAKNLGGFGDAQKEKLYQQYFPDYFSTKLVDHIKSLEDLEPDAAPTSMLPSAPQSVVNMVMKHIASLGHETTNRGMLAWHSTGSGKTCTASGVIDAFWEDEGRDIIFVSSLDAIASNPDYKFHECAMNLYPRFQQEPFLGSGSEETLANIGAAFEKRGVRFLSFAKLSNRVRKWNEYRRMSGGKKEAIADSKSRGKSKDSDKPKVKAPVVPEKEVFEKRPRKSKHDMERLNKEEYIDLNKCVLVIDEVHNLFRPLATQRQQHEYLEKQLLDPRKYPNLKIVILTATPGDNIPDVIKLLNIVRDPTHKPIEAPNIEDADDIRRFKQSIRGLISFFDMSSDLTKFPQVVDHAPIKYPMSMTQFNRYVEAYHEVKADAKDFDKLAKVNLTNKYWAGPRRYANSLYNFDKNMALSDFSSKMPALLENIEKEPSAKHYVYSAFFENRGYGGHGILAIAKELDKMGYTKMTVKDAKKINLTGKMPEKAKRYVLAITNEIGDEGSSSAGRNLHEMIKVYNSSENKNGDYIHVFLASQGFNEGIDLKGVRHIHIFEPLVTWASDKQTLGRAARYCSHADLDRDNGEWKVEIHRYMSDLPLELKRPSFNNDSAKQRQIEARLEMLTSDLAGLNKKTQKDEIAEVKALIKEAKAELKALTKEKAGKKKLDLENIKNIEEQIYNESRDRMKNLLIVYQAMKEAAVDCRILQTFHNATGNNLRCDYFEHRSE